LDTIVGWNGRGLIPGGSLFNKSRTHIYCVTNPPPRDSWAYNPDRRHGTDVVIQLDHDRIAEENRMFMTAKGAVLLQKAVPIRHILRINLLGCPSYTIWRRPEKLDPPQRWARCQLCTREYKNGTTWCYEGCWMPLTWMGVHIALNHERKQELWECYGLTFPGLQAIQEVKGTASRNLPLGTFSDKYTRRQCSYFRIAPPGSEYNEKGASFQKKARQNERTAAAAPALAAVMVTVPTGLSSASGTGATGSSTAPAGTTVRLTPRGSVATAPPAVPSLEGNSAESRAYRKALMGDISNKKVSTLEKAARKNKATDGSHFLSHTDRWNRCGVYRGQMQRDGTPKWLVWPSTGLTAREDGGDAGIGHLAAPAGDVVFPCVSNLVGMPSIFWSMTVKSRRNVGCAKVQAHYRRGGCKHIPRV
jgi:hypothetical protein